jgi:hypothetical protein
MLESVVFTHCSVYAVVLLLVLARRLYLMINHLVIYVLSLKD